MKYCNKCSVNVNHNHNNCPLCGSYLNKSNDNDNCQAYLPLDNIVSHPVVKINSTVSFLKNKLSKILLTACVIAFLLNLLFARTTPWSAYVIIGAMVAIFAIIMPIAEKTKLQKQIRHNLFLFTLVAVALELTITRLHFEWFVVFDILPWFYAGTIILIDFLIIFRRYEDNGLFATLILATLFAITPQIINWVQMILNDAVKLNLITVTIFFASLFNMAVVFIVCTRSVREEMQRNFNI